MGVYMISWIDKEYKKYYKSSGKAVGIRYKTNEIDSFVLERLGSFVSFLRKKYYFPIRLNVLFCNTSCFRHHIDNHVYYGAFYSMDDEKRMVYPRISIAAKVTDTNTMENIFFTLAHEITHYYQWYFIEDEKRTSKSLEREANKWAEYILNLYFINEK